MSRITSYVYSSVVEVTKRWRLFRRPPFRVAGEQAPLRPFLLEYRSESVRSNGDFLPNTRVSLSPEFELCDLFRILDAQDISTLLVAVSMVTRSGGFVVTPERLALQLRLPRGAVLLCLKRLSRIHWQGRPLASLTQTPNGLWLFVPSPELFETESNAILPVPSGLQPREVLLSDSWPFPAPPLPSRRETNIARSRARYSRPRAEVEAEIERFLSGEDVFMRGHVIGNDGIMDADDHGADKDMEESEQVKTASATAHTEPDAPRQREESSQARHWLVLKKRLVAVGLSHSQADNALEQYPFERIERQLGWLPYRHAHRPTAYLLAAMHGDYAPPRSLSQLPATNLSHTKTPALSKSLEGINE